MVDGWTPEGDNLAGATFPVDGVAVPIVVAGEVWGTLGAAFGARSVPAGAEERLERFGRLVSLAISNAAAWERLDHQASADALTGIAVIADSLSTAETLVQAADHALYEAKESGRNTTVVRGATVA